MSTTTFDLFLVQATDRIHRSLRRFTLSVSPRSRCALPSGVHDARVPLDEVVVPQSGMPPLMQRPHVIAMDDPRWPAACPCGYRFLAKDPRQVTEDRLFERVDIPGFKRTMRELPPGALIDAEWLREDNAPTYADGMCLAVVLSSGELWLLDCESQSRTGTPPRITLQSERRDWIIIDGVLSKA